MEVVQPRRSYRTLDGLRGVGAFMVVMRHVPGFFGPIRVPESFLAVDLFYLVSGFVVAHAYGERLKAGGYLKAFMKTRLIRLYPLYFVGMAIGLVAAVLSLINDPRSFWSGPKLLEAVVLGLIMFPRLPGVAANGSTLNGPTWTLLPELIGNLAYALLIRFMSVRLLAIILVVCGAGLVVAELQFHTLDVGYSPNDQWTALVRVGYSFFAGVLLFRYVGQKEHTSEWAAWACLALLAFLLGFAPAKAQMAYYELGAVLLGMPALVVLAARFEPRALSGRLFSYIGLVSYGVYIVHQPLGNMAVGAVKRFMHIPHDARGLVLGVVFLAAMVGLAGWLDRFYDAPVRRVLRAWFMAERPKPPVAKPPSELGSAPEGL
jgi:peptidoglycan/LPS O-acetylase OafA/YrhL